MVYQVLCGYKDYSSAVSLRQIITARILEGFFLRAFHVSRREGRRSKVQITLALPWIPNVTVLYTIRTSWGDMKTPLMEDSIGHKHRIELNVLAYRQFVMLFINMQKYEKTDLTYENTLHDKVVVLHSYLNRTVETDGTILKNISNDYLDWLDNLSNFNSREALSFIASLSTDSSRDNSSADISRSPLTDTPALDSSDLEKSAKSKSAGSRSRAYWHTLSRFVESRDTCFDDWSCYFILQVSDTEISSEHRQKSQALKAVLVFLEEWSTYTISKGLFMKLIYASETETDLPVAFCIVRIEQHTEFLYEIRLLFSTIGLELEKRIIKDLQTKLRNLHDIAGKGVISICEKPIPRLLIKYGTDQRRRFKRQLSSEYYLRDHASFIFTPVLRAYLRSQKFNWFEGLNEMILGCGGVPDRDSIMQVAHDLMLNALFEEGFLRIHESSFSTTMFMEISLSVNASCAVQYVLIRDKEAGTLSTELWMEPVLQIVDSGEFQEKFDSFKNSIRERDQSISDFLFTFLALKLLASDSVKSYSVILNSGTNVDCRFSLKALLEESVSYQGVGFLIGSFFGGGEVTPESSSSEEEISPLRKSTNSIKGVQSTSMLVEEDVEFADVAKTAFSMATGDNEKGYIVFYKFFEQCLANVCDGRLSTSDMNQPRETRDFLSMIKTALDENLELSSSIMLAAVDDSVCFVKDFGEQGILLILMPMCDQTESLKGIACVSMFECARPSNQFVFQSKVGGTHRPIINAVDSFDHFTNGSLIFSRGQLEFGCEFLPLIYQAYWYACGKSFYFAILTAERISPRIVGFKEILNAATKGNLDIDITRYLEVDALIRTKGIKRFVCQFG